MLRSLLTALALTAGALAAFAQSHDPIRQILANFDRIDADRDGVISRDEFRDVQAVRWTQIDRNRDGFLSEDDFPRAAAGRARTHLAGIAHLDENGDGRISQGEFVDAALPMFRCADRSGDGTLSRSDLEVAQKACRDHAPAKTGRVGKLERERVDKAPEVFDVRRFGTG